MRVPLDTKITFPDLVTDPYAILPPPARSSTGSQGTLSWSDHVDQGGEHKNGQGKPRCVQLG